MTRRALISDADDSIREVVDLGQVEIPVDGCRWVDCPADCVAPFWRFARGMFFVDVSNWKAGIAYRAHYGLPLSHGADPEFEYGGAA